MTWYYRQNGVTVGPLSSTELRQHALEGKLTRECSVRREGKDRWAAAGKVKGLFGPSVSPLPPAAETTPPEGPSERPDEDRDLSPGLPKPFSRPVVYGIVSFAVMTVAVIAWGTLGGGSPAPKAPPATSPPRTVANPPVVRSSNPDREADLAALRKVVRLLIDEDRNVKTKLGAMKREGEAKIRAAYPGADNFIATGALRELNNDMRNRLNMWGEFLLGKMVKVGAAGVILREKHGIDDKDLADQVGRIIKELEEINRQPEPD